MIQRAAASVALAAVLILGVATAAQAAPRQTTIQGQVLRLVSVQDPEAMSAMTPGVPVAWDIEVTADEPDGMIDLSLESTVAGGRYRATVASCSVAWASGGCDGQAVTLLHASLTDGRLPIGTQAATEHGRYRVSVELVEAADNARAELVFRAVGEGDSVATGGSMTLPSTGSSVAQGVSLAFLAVGAGLLLALLARWRRRGEDAA